LRIGIARGRSYTSVLVISRRKTSLCEAPHGRRPWPDLKLHGSSWELTGEGKEKGKERRGTGRRLGRGAARGAPWWEGAVGASSLFHEAFSVLACVR
jgi:hypothetical protein